MTSLDGLLCVRGTLISFFVDQRGDHVGANSPSVLAVEDKALWRVVDTSLVSGIDLQRLSGLQNNTSRDCVDDFATVSI